MTPDKKISEELKDISPVLAKLERVNVFEVPDGYFENLPGFLVSLAAESKSIDGIDFPALDVPEGYFESLAGNILQKIKTEENHEKLFVESLSKVNPFHIPENYFDNLTENIMASIHNKKGKIVTMSLRNTFIKYAVAAMLTGALALTVYKYTGNSNNNQLNSTTQLATLDPSIEKGKNMDEKQFALTLNSLSEDEIAAYLEKYGDEKDLQVLASIIDEKKLPTQDEYFLDANILEKYLGEDSSTK